MNFLVVRLYLVLSFNCLFEVFVFLCKDLVEALDQTLVLMYCIAAAAHFIRPLILLAQPYLCRAETVVTNAHATLAAVIPWSFYFETSQFRGTTFEESKANLTPMTIVCFFKNYKFWVKYFTKIFVKWFIFWFFNYCISFKKSHWWLSHPLNSGFTIWFHFLLIILAFCHSKLTDLLADFSVHDLRLVGFSVHDLSSVAEVAEHLVVIFVLLSHWRSTILVKLLDFVWIWFVIWICEITTWTWH